MDHQMFWPILIFLLAVAIPISINPEKGGQILNAVLGFTTSKLGWLFLAYTIGIFFFLLWLAFGRYGNVKLGEPDDEPEFNYFTWVSMLFCSGIGASLIYWSIIEPIYYYQGPPFGIEPGSTVAVEWGAMYGMFHWGFSAWAIYAIPTLPIAYAMYVRKLPNLRMSTACSGLIGEHSNGIAGKVIDTMAMFGIVGGVATVLGLGVPMIATIMGELFNIQSSFLLQIIVIIIWTGIIAVSMWLGLQKGIAKLANFTVIICLVFVGYVLLVGPTIFILDLFSNSLGLLLNNFFMMSLWTDPILKGGFPEGWTVFYWAWWLALAPLMGMFVAKISKGRTIKELVVAELVWGTLGCWIYFAVFGGYSLHLQINNIIPLASLLSQSGAPVAILAVFKSLPLAGLVLPVVLVIWFVFSGTTFNSAAYTLASGTTKNLEGDEEPVAWFRLLWAFIIGVVAMALLAVGSLSAVQVSSVVLTVPLIPIFIIMIISFMKWLKEDHGPALAPVKRGFKYSKTQGVQEQQVNMDGNKIDI